MNAATTKQPSEFPQDSPRVRWLAERQTFLQDGTALGALLKKANGAGEHLLVIEMGEAALSEGRIADAVPILQQMARALAVLGSIREAKNLLDGIALGRADDAETLGLSARIEKDLAAAASTPEERVAFLREAQDHYSKGYHRALEAGDHGGAAYCGINAATLAVWLDDRDLARALASKTREQVTDDASYYGIATRAEAALILGHGDEATELYRAAAAIAARENRWADLASTRKQCRELCLKLHGRRDHMESAFPSGTVAVVSAEALAADVMDVDAVHSDAVGKRVLAWASEHSIRSMFSGARPGWDLLVAEKLQAAGVEAHLILPCAEDRFVESVLLPKGESWVKRFHAVRANAVSVTVLHEITSADPNDSVEFTERMIAARGALLAQHLGFSLKALLMRSQWEKTSASVWTQANLALHVIHPAEPERDGTPDKDAKAEPVPFARALKPAPTQPKVAVCAMLLLHFPRYGGMSDAHFTAFQTEVLGVIASKLALAERPPINRQGFGGSYLFVFDQLYPAAAMAIELLEALKSQTTNALMMPTICLHAGPVWQMINPVLNLYAHEGAAITRAASLAARMPSGHAYATETFTALSALESLRGIRFEHAGISVIDGRGDRLFLLHSS
jgi:adenylate cyclase